MTVCDAEAPDVDWDAVLDAYDAGLDHLRAILQSADGVPAGHPPWPPRSLPTSPMPPAVAPRARALLEESHALIDAIAKRMTELPKPRRQQGRPSREFAAPRIHSQWQTVL